MGYHTSQWLLDGIVANYTQQELVEGFQTSIASKINRGDMLKGNIYVTPTVTPMLNTINGAMSANSEEVNTGASSLTSLG